MMLDHLGHEDAARAVERAPNLDLGVYHFMVGSQVLGREGFIRRLRRTIGVGLSGPGVRSMMLSKTCASPRSRTLSRPRVSAAMSSKDSDLRKGAAMVPNSSLRAVRVYIAGWHEQASAEADWLCAYSLME